MSPRALQTALFACAAPVPKFYTRRDLKTKIDLVLAEDPTGKVDAVCIRLAGTPMREWIVSEVDDMSWLFDGVGRHFWLVTPGSSVPAIHGRVFRPHMGLMFDGFGAWLRFCIF